MKHPSLVLLCASLATGCSTSTGNTGQTGSGSTGATAGQAGGTGSSASGATQGTGSVSGSSSTSGNASGSAVSSGASASGAVSSGTSSGSTSGNPASGSATGASAGATGTSSGGVGSGSTGASGAGTSSGGVDVDAGLPPGSVNAVPAGYMGQPFATNVIPGIIYIANYDTGGAGIAFCHSTTMAMTAAGCMGGDLGDWCCGTIKGCNEISQPDGSATYCPPYRGTGDNAGLSHMNLGEPDCYASTGPTWQFVAGSNGPTLDGPMVTAGTPVPQNLHATSVEDAYLSYTYTGEWLKFTVEVLSAGTYAIGSLMGVPGGTQLTIDFGNNITTGTFTPTASPCTWTCPATECGGVQKGCPETYHSWENLSNLATVMIPAPGTYVMTFTIVQGTINPLFFTFTKM